VLAHNQASTDRSAGGPRSGQQSVIDYDDAAEQYTIYPAHGSRLQRSAHPRSAAADAKHPTLRR